MSNDSDYEDLHNQKEPAMKVVMNKRGIPLAVFVVVGTSVGWCHISALILGGITGLAIKAWMVFVVAAIVAGIIFWRFGPRGLGVEECYEGYDG